MKLPYEEFDLSGIQTYPLKSRQSRVRIEQFAKPYAPGSGARGLFDSLPAVLAASDFKDAIAAIRTARQADRPIIWGIGAHVIKTGLSPVLIDLMERGFVSAIATNGAGIIHDFEIALAGATSEDVEEALGPGRFGMAEETATLLNKAVVDGARDGMGFGQSVCRFLGEGHPQYERYSMHPLASGSAIGDTSLRDFRFFTSSVARLERGVYLNCGSAVILPEVFLKSVALARNQGRSLDGLTTINLDFVRQYRPLANVVSRPTAGIGRGYSITGHHELIIPLLAAALIEGT